MLLLLPQGAGHPDSKGTSGQQCIGEHITACISRAQPEANISVIIVCERTAVQNWPRWTYALQDAVVSEPKATGLQL